MSSTRQFDKPSVRQAVRRQSASAICAVVVLAVCLSCQSRPPNAGERETRKAAEPGPSPALAAAPTATADTQPNVERKRHALPPSDLAKLVIEPHTQGLTLILRVHNETDWYIKEILVEVTGDGPRPLRYRLVPVVWPADLEDMNPSDRRVYGGSDLTQLPPLSNGAFGMPFGGRLFSRPTDRLTVTLLSGLGCKDPTHCD